MLLRNPIHGLFQGAFGKSVVLPHSQHQAHPCMMLAIHPRIALNTLFLNSVFSLVTMLFSLPLLAQTNFREMSWAANELSTLNEAQPLQLALRIRSDGLSVLVSSNRVPPDHVRKLEDYADRMFREIAANTPERKPGAVDGFQSHGVPVGSHEMVWIVMPKTMESAIPKSKHQDSGAEPDVKLFKQKLGDDAAGYSLLGQNWWAVPNELACFAYRHDQKQKVELTCEAVR